MKQPAVIIDVNGTLGDCSKRKHFLDSDPRDWDGFFEHMMIDKPVDIVHRFVNAQKNEPFFCHVLLVTGAPEKYRTLMLKWLSENMINFDQLYMRGNTQFVKGFEFKRRLILDSLESQYDLVLALDDKQECADMYRSLGIPCWVTSECPYPRKESQAKVEHVNVGRTPARRTWERGRQPRPR